MLPGGHLPVLYDDLLLSVVQASVLAAVDLSAI